MEWTKNVFCFFFYVSFPFNTVRPCTLKRRNERTFAGETRPIVKNIRNSIAVDITFRNASLPSTAIRKWIDQRVNLVGGRLDENLRRKNDFNVVGKKSDNGALLVQRLLLFRTEGK